MENIIKVSHKGIEAEVDKRVFEDIRFTMAIGCISDESLTDDERMVWYSRMTSMLLGASAFKVLGLLAEANGGFLDAESYNAFFLDVIEQAKAKNS